MRAVLFLVGLLTGRPGPGPETLPQASVRLDAGAHRLVIELPPVEVPAAGRGREAMVGLPLCQVVVPVNAPLHRSKAFDLPPGRTERFWEGSPAIPGTILGLGGHLHDYGVSLELTDATAGTVLWRGAPVTDAAGRVLSFPLTRFYNWRRLGV